jgi:hypothetical protein
VPVQSLNLSQAKQNQRHKPLQSETKSRQVEAEASWQSFNQKQTKTKRETYKQHTRGKAVLKCASGGGGIACSDAK